MGRLIVAVLVVALAWMSFWFFASISLERGIRAYIEGPQEGVEVMAGDIGVTGFPNRLDTTLTDLVVTLPETQTQWRAPFAQLLALVYRPTELILAVAPTHAITTPFQSIAISNDRARASVALSASTDLALDRATLVIDDGRALSSLGWEASLAQTRLSIAETDISTYRLGAEGLDIELSVIPPELPGRFSRVHLDATAGFTKPWDRFAMNAERLPQFTQIRVDDLSLSWGPMRFEARGDLDVDMRGRPEGRLELSVRNWRAALDALDRMGLLGERVGPAVEFGLAALADGDTLSAPLVFQAGIMRLGPLPLGPAPNLTIR
jgi:hypothetical protein